MFRIRLENLSTKMVLDIKTVVNQLLKEELSSEVAVSETFQIGRPSTYQINIEGPVEKQATIIKHLAPFF